MTRPFVVLAAVVLMLGCGEAASREPAPTTREAFLMLAAPTFTPCVTVFGPIARGLDFSASVGRLDASGEAVETVEATFSLHDAAGEPVAFDLPRPGTFLTRFARAGLYELTATLADGTTLRQDLEVAEQAGLRLSPLFRRVTTHTAAGDCADTQNTVVFAGEGAVALALNQVLETSVVPVDAEGALLLGTLELELSGELNVSKSTTWLGYRFEPTRPGRGVVHVTDLATGQRAELEFDVAADATTCPAQE